MSKTEYRGWWKLHRRAAVGETLTDAEQTAYEDGLARLHAGKTLMISLERLQAIKECIAELEPERERMAAEWQELRMLFITKAKGQSVAEQHSVVDILAEAPGHLVFLTADQVDAYLCEERKAWER